MVNPIQYIGLSELVYKELPIPSKFKLSRAGCAIAFVTETYVWQQTESCRYGALRPASRLSQVWKAAFDSSKVDWVATATVDSADAKMVIEPQPDPEPQPEPQHNPNRTRSHTYVDVVEGAEPTVHSASGGWACGRSRGSTPANAVKERSGHSASSAVTRRPPRRPNSSRSSAAQSIPRCAPVHAAAATALLNRDADGMYAAAQQFEQIGAMLSATDTAAQPAVLFDARDNRRTTTEAAALADRLAAACGGIKTPALILAANPLPLSTREREIANLVAAGLSNREIAERLSVSTRTVEGHIYRACIKLDVSDRDALADLIRGGKHR